MTSKTMRLTSRILQTFLLPPPLKVMEGYRMFSPASVYIQPGNLYLSNRTSVYFIHGPSIPNPEFSMPLLAHSADTYS